MDMIRLQGAYHGLGSGGLPVKEGPCHAYSHLPQLPNFQVSTPPDSMKTGISKGAGKLWSEPEGHRLWELGNCLPNCIIHVTPDSCI